MAEQKYEIKVTCDLRPAYYDSFHCLAQDCHISCCKGWRISFDKKDYLSLKRQKGSPKLNMQVSHGLRRIRGKDTLLTENVDAEYAEIQLEDGDCPFLCENGLCNLQIEKGHQALPKICKTFPRTQNYEVSGYLERSLGLSCEGVLDLLWDLPQGIDFLSDPLDKNEKHAVITFRNPENSMLVHFQEIRSWCIDMLQNRQYPLPERILRMGIALKWLADGEKDIAHWLEQAQALAESKKALFIEETEQNHALPLFLSNNLRLLSRLQSQNKELELLRQKILGVFLRNH